MRGISRQNEMLSQSRVKKTVIEAALLHCHLESVDEILWCDVCDHSNESY